MADLGFTTVTAEQAKDLLAKEPIFLDVRSARHKHTIHCGRGGGRPPVQQPVCGHKPKQAPPLINLLFPACCRTPEEFAKGHYAGAVNVPVQLTDDAGKMQPNPEFKQQVEAALPDKDAPVVCSCFAGRRGGLAAGDLAEAGYTAIHNVAGGLSALSKAGVPLSGNMEEPAHHHPTH